MLPHGQFNENCFARQSCNQAVMSDGLEEPGILTAIPIEIVPAIPFGMLLVIPTRPSLCRCPSFRRDRHCADTRHSGETTVVQIPAIPARSPLCRCPSFRRDHRCADARHSARSRGIHRFGTAPAFQAWILRLRFASRRMTEIDERCWLNDGRCPHFRLACCPIFRRDHARHSDKTAIVQIPVIPARPPLCRYPSFRRDRHCANTRHSGETAIVQILVIPRVVAESKDSARRRHFRHGFCHCASLRAG